MIVTDSTCFEPKEDYKIWRYLDLARFLDLLTSSQIYFSRLDKFEDPYEGYVPANDDYLKRIAPVFNYMNKFQYANCWHINENESAAMWKLYLDSKNGIAIQSTVNRLKKSLQGTAQWIYISEIQYRDYSKINSLQINDAIRNPNSMTIQSKNNVEQIAFFPGTFKRKSFEHERELRVICKTLYDPNFQDKMHIEPDTPFGKKINCEIADLIESIYISPTSDVWFENLVNTILIKLNIKFQLIPSKLYAGFIK
jgi:hypothetical protein